MKLLERVADVYYQWRALTAPSGTPTFAALWATGAVVADHRLLPYCDDGSAAAGTKGGGANTARMLRLGRGLVSPEWHARAAPCGTRTALPPLSFNDLNPSLAKVTAAAVAAHAQPTDCGRMNTPHRVCPHAHTDKPPPTVSPSHVDGPPRWAASR